jgi:hypothetical protein
VGSVIGSILGARAAGGRGGGSTLISTAASMMGSALASRAAGSLVQAVHEDSKQRALERRERDAAIARGETPSAREVPVATRERVFQDAGRAFQRAAGAAVSGGAGVGSRGRTIDGASSYAGSESTADSNGRGLAQNADGRGRFSWTQAAELVLEAVSVCAEMQKQGGERSNSKRRHK